MEKDKILNKIQKAVKYSNMTIVSEMEPGEVYNTSSFTVDRYVDSDTGEVLYRVLFYNDITYELSGDNRQALTLVGFVSRAQDVIVIEEVFIRGYLSGVNNAEAELDENFKIKDEDY